MTSKRLTRRGRVLGRIALLVIVACIAAIVVSAVAGHGKKPAAATSAPSGACWQAIKADGYNGELKAERTPACRKLSTPALNKLLADEDQSAN